MPRLLAWHKANKRSFIWRGLKRSPYVVLVSEFMLQQTGTKHVERRLPIFLKEFPTVKSLAAAPPAKVIRAWQGLGYNRRALYLHRAAEALATMRTFPRTLEALKALPGVGRYTASAVLAFAYNADTPVVDVNVERVLSRLRKKMPDNRSTLPKDELYDFDASVLPKGHSAEWHEALMDLGATICTKREPKCGDCPVRRSCPSASMRQTPRTEVRPEVRHFGEPQRIWRGRILRQIAEAESITPKMLVAQLKKRYAVRDAGFSRFIERLVGLLVDEHFVSRGTDGGLTLASK